MLRNRRGIFGFGAMVVAALVAVVACGGDDPTQTPEQLSSVDAESQFLARLATIAGASSDAELEIRNQLVEGPQARDDTLARIVEIGFGWGREAELAAAEGLQPPERFQEDHQSYLEWLREAGVPLSRELAGKARDGDVVGVAVAFAKYDVPRFRLLATVSSVYCGALGVPAGATICHDDIALPYGEYGSQVHDLAVSFGSEVRRGGVLFPALRPEELVQAVLMVQPALIESLESVLVSARALEPPDSISRDHGSPGAVP